MRFGFVSAAVLSACLGISSCTPPPPPANPEPPGERVYRSAARRIAAVVVSGREELGSWAGQRFSRGRAPRDADGGSAVPITADGYFLTAEHVLATAEGRNVFVVHGGGGRMTAHPARIVWRSPEHDLALLHVPIRTPEHYRWTPAGEWLPRGTPVMHGGIATGFDSSPGRLVSAVRPENAFSGAQRFKHDIPLEPGDSGGPVLDARGLLVGVNSAVEFLVPLETAFFIESEGNRPHLGRLRSLIESDRKNQPAQGVGAP